MAEFPAMRLWTDAYLGDTTHLTTIEHGAYLLLLITMWRAKGGKLPDDDNRLAKFTRLTPAQWRRIRPTIMEFFMVENGMLSNGRLSDELNAVRQQRLSSSNAGKASALKRLNRGPTDVERDGQRNSNLHNHNHNHKKEPPIVPQNLGDEIEIENLGNEGQQVDPAPSVEALAASLEAEFAEWYELYPRQEGIAKARRAFTKARQKVTLDVLIDGLRAYLVEVAGKDRQYIAHPATWLHGERWADQESGAAGKPNIPPEELLKIRVERASDWLSRNPTIPDWMNDPAVAAELVKQGHEWSRLRKAGFDMPKGRR